MDRSKQGIDPPKLSTKLLTLTWIACPTMKKQQFAISTRSSQASGLDHLMISHMSSSTWSYIEAITPTTSPFSTFFCNNYDCLGPTSTQLSYSRNLV
mmetsp:Transcript_7341/g.11065  ORF Transcript_7341/g.11065 Transcript_7341/m.11065 type:complete len:97 (-) Transcript_7341:201-491(-)